MPATLTKLIRRQEQNISMVKQRILFSRKANCPGCHSKIVLNHTGKSTKLCFFCTNCQLLFEK